MGFIKDRNFIHDENQIALWKFFLKNPIISKVYLYFYLSVTLPLIVSNNFEEKKMKNDRNPLIDVKMN